MAVRWGGATICGHSPITLDSRVGLSDTEVMASDIDWGAIFGVPVAPASATPVPAAPAVVDPTGELTRLRGIDEHAMQQHVQGLLEGLRQREGAVDPLEPHQDGTTAIGSMIAVYLLTEVAASIGQPRLVALASVDRELLESVRGLAKLVRRHLPGEAT